MLLQLHVKIRNILQFAVELTKIIFGPFGSLLPQKAEIFLSKFNQFLAFALL